MTRTPRSPAAPALAPRAGVVGLAAVLLVVVVGVRPAAGHGASDGIRYVLDEVTPAVEGLTVQVVRGLGAQLVLGNDTGEVVEVLDDAGRPFLRVGPDGVEGNVASPAWRASDRPYELGGGDPDADAPAGEAWVPLGDDPSWGWYDHRLHERELAVPADATGPVELDTWAVPLRVGGDREVTVAGRTLGGPPLGYVAPRLAVDREPADGLSVTLLPGAVPGLLVQVEDGHEATVLGAAGEPFLRFGAGVVEVNDAAPTWHRIGGTGSEEAAVDGAAPPSWRQVAASQQFAWVEPRATVPEVDGNPADGAVLSSWSVPVRLDGQEVPLVGELVWTRTAAGADGAAEDGPGVPWPNVLLAAAGVGAIVALLLVRRQSADRP